MRASKHRSVDNRPPLVDNRWEDKGREENADAFEIMQVWKADTTVYEDVRGM